MFDKWDCKIFLLAQGCYETIKNTINQDNMRLLVFSCYHVLIIGQYFNHLDHINIAQAFMKQREAEKLLCMWVCGFKESLLRQP